MIGSLVTTTTRWIPVTRTMIVILISILTATIAMVRSLMEFILAFVGRTGLTGLFFPLFSLSQHYKCSRHMPPVVCKLYQVVKSKGVVPVVVGVAGKGSYRCPCWTDRRTWRKKRRPRRAWQP